MSPSRPMPSAVPLAVFVLAASLLASGIAMAQTVVGAQPAVPATDPNELSGNRGIDRRLDRNEQTLRDLRAIVLAAKAAGKPVEVKDAGPDPALADMQGKLDDLTMSLSRLSGEVETLTHDLQVTQKALADSTEANKALVNRISKLEGAVQVLQTTPPAPSTTGALGQLSVSAAPAAVAAAPGPPDQSAAPGGADEILAYRQARQVLDTGDYAGGAAALQDYLTRYPTSPRALEANYWLGRTLALQAKHPEAADAFARSLKGWPQGTWTGDAVVRLAASLVEMKRADDACKALAEFDGRYAAKAAPAVKLRAKDVRTRAACS